MRPIDAILALSFSVMSTFGVLQIIALFAELDSPWIFMLSVVISCFLTFVLLGWKERD